MKFDPQSFETKWRERFAAKDPSLADDARATAGDKRFVLVEFPYPSGNLHVGHWYAFSVPDIYVRQRRMAGENVLFPIGFDAFGLPAENAAIKHGLNPRDWTRQNMAKMEEQLRSMGASFDWSRKVATCEPDYYRWTQWLFLKLLDAGLAYQAETAVNWCPNDKTVLANEQVKEGKCDRCGAGIEQRRMKQWMLRITKFADALVDDLDALPAWPEAIKAAQREWIGRSEGAEIDFKIDGGDDSVTVFTTRADTLFGVTYVVLAPEHPLAQKLSAGCPNRAAIEAYVSEATKKRELDRLAGAAEKTGVCLEGVFAVNPANGEKVPVWIADYVLGSYGTGAVMAVPAHDERDRAFTDRKGGVAKTVISPDVSRADFWAHAHVGFSAAVGQGEDLEQADLRRRRDALEGLLRGDGCWTGDGVLINSGEFDGLASAQAGPKIGAKFGRLKTQYRLRDWLVSRQRYWGCPIPVVHCPSCGPVGVPEVELPVKLPEIDSYLPADDGSSPLARSPEFVAAKCPKCGGEARRETDTLDTFIDSSWYYYRYADPKNESTFADRAKVDSWLPVDVYSGGAEHTTMHVLYARFFQKALASIGLAPAEEPFRYRFNRSLIMGPDGQKMSKSKGNVIDPDVEVGKYGADTVRMYLAFMGPYAEVNSYPWDPNGVTGIRRFLERVWNLVARVAANPEATSAPEAHAAVHRALVKVGEDVARFKFNTAISAMMTALNEIGTAALSRADLEIFLRMLAPFAPFAAAEMWEVSGASGEVHAAPWPEPDLAALQSEAATVAVQVNGKVRASISLPRGAAEAEALAVALANPTVQKFLAGATPKRVIHVADKLLSLVV